MSVTQSSNAVVSDPIQTAISALEKGQDPMTAVYGEAEASSVDTPPQESSDNWDPQAFMEGQDVSEEEDSQPETEEEPSSETLSADSEEEELEVVDQRGRRKKVKVDFSDKARQRKYVQDYHAAIKGMRQFQVERDQALKDLKQEREGSSESKEVIQSLEKAFKLDGIKGVINLIAGAEDAYDKHIDKEYARRRLREDATPFELEKLELQEKLERAQREQEAFRQQMEEDRKAAEAKREETELKSLRSDISPVFMKYNFTGKLGNSTTENRWNKALWQQAMEELESLPDEVDLSAEVVDKTFRRIAADIRGDLKRTAEAKTKAVLQKKKQDAQESAAIKAMNGVKRGSEADAFREDMKNGNITSALTRVLTGKFNI